MSCENCGRETERRITELARNTTGRFFCSNACRKELGGKPRRRADKACEQCGGSFYPLDNAGARFCGRACYAAYGRRTRVAFKCEVCGKDFTLPPSQVVNQTGRFCSRACESASRIKRPLGRDHNGKPAVLDNNGYVRIYQPDHPRSTKAGWVHEHRYLVEQALGRLLASDEHVHHINHVKDDNRPENLEVLSHGEHSSITGKENGKRLKEWGRYRERFGPLD